MKIKIDKNGKETVLIPLGHLNNDSKEIYSCYPETIYVTDEMLLLPNEPKDHEVSQEFKDAIKHNIEVGDIFYHKDPYDPFFYQKKLKNSYQIYPNISVKEGISGLYTAKDGANVRYNRFINCLIRVKQDGIWFLIRKEGFMEYTGLSVREREDKWVKCYQKFIRECAKIKSTNGKDWTGYKIEDDVQVDDLILGIKNK